LQKNLVVRRVDDDTDCQSEHVSQTAGLAGFVRLGLRVAIAKEDAHVVQNIASHFVCISAVHALTCHSPLSFSKPGGGCVFTLRLVETLLICASVSLTINVTRDRFEFHP
jgi:hypothetical protein